MKTRFLVLAVAVLALCFAPASQAQFHLSIAPVVGMNFNLHTGSDLDATGTGVGVVLGGQAIMTFSPMIGLMSGLTFYDNRSGSFTKSFPSKQYTNATANEDNSISLAYFQIENLFLLRLPRTDLIFMAGPVVGFNIEGSYDNSTKTVDNTDPNLSVTSKAKGSLKDLLVRFELKFGAAYDIHVSKNLIIFPQLTFGFGLTKVQSDVSWRVLTIQSVVGVRFNVL